MKTIDVHDLPEGLAKALAETVEHLRFQLAKRGGESRACEQVVWPLGVKGSLSRKEIYEHLDD